MKGVYRVNFTVIDEEHAFTNYFFCKDIDEIRSSLTALFADFNTTNPYVSDGCIYATSDEHDLLISIESTNILDDQGLASLI